MTARVCTDCWPDDGMDCDTCKGEGFIMDEPDVPDFDGENPPVPPAEIMDAPISQYEVVLLTLHYINTPQTYQIAVDDQHTWYYNTDHNTLIVRPRKCGLPRVEMPLFNVTHIEVERCLAS